MMRLLRWLVRFLTLPFTRSFWRFVLIEHVGLHRPIMVPTTPHGTHQDTSMQKAEQQKRMRELERKYLELVIGSKIPDDHER